MLWLLKAVPFNCIQDKQMLPDVHTRGLPGLAATRLFSGSSSSDVSDSSAVHYAAGGV